MTPASSAVADTIAESLRHALRRRSARRSRLRTCCGADPAASPLPDLCTALLLADARPRWARLCGRDRRAVDAPPEWAVPPWCGTTSRRSYSRLGVRILGHGRRRRNELSAGESDVGNICRPGRRAGRPGGRVRRRAADGTASTDRGAGGPPKDDDGAVETLPLRSAQGRWVVVAATLASAIAFLDGTVVNVALRPIA